MRQKSILVSILALMLVLFIDGMGQGIIFPILSKTLANASSRLFFTSDSVALHAIWFGLIIGSYYLAWFLSAPLLGGWSDGVGRKKPLMTCLLLAAMSFLTAAFAIDIGSLWLLLIARLLGGATSGDQAIAKAAIIDICPKDKKPIYFGLILCSVTLGLVTGPLAGAYLQNPLVFPSFNSQTPLYFAALLSLLNIFLLQLFFYEKASFKTVQKPRLSKAIKLLRESFKAKWIKLLLIIYFLTQLGWQIFYIDMQEFTVNRFHADTTQASLAVALLGLGIFVGLVALPRLFKEVRPKVASLIGYSVLATSNGVILFTSSIIIIYSFSIIAAAFFGLAAVNMLAMLSAQADLNQQGWVMGISGSIVALTGAIGAIITGILSSLSTVAPYAFSLLAILAGIIIISSSSYNEHLKG